MVNFEDGINFKVHDENILFPIPAGHCMFFFNFYVANPAAFLTSAQSNAKIEELLQEDHNAKRRREKCQKQSSLLSKLTRQLSIHDNRASSYSDDSSGAGKLRIL